MRVHVSDVREGNFGPFYVLHKVDENDNAVLDSANNYISCIISARKIKNKYLEYAELDEVASLGDVKWKTSRYSISIRPPAPNKLEILDDMRGYMEQIRSSQLRIANNQETINKLIPELLQMWENLDIAEDVKDV